MTYSNDPIKYKISARIHLKKFWPMFFSRFIYILPILASFLIFFFISYFVVFRKFDNLYESAINKIYDATNSVTSTISTKKSDIFAYLSLKQTNKQLREQNEHLQQLLLTYKNIQAENEELKKLTKFSAQENDIIKSTRIIMKSVDKYIDLAVIPVGSIDGIKEGHIVMNSSSVIGRVVEVSENSSKILLITSLNSKLPIVFTKSGYKAILSGYYNGKLSVSILDSEKLPELGELVITSGDDGYFPPGLTVGEVTKTEGEFIEITPIFNPEKTSIVLVLENKTNKNGDNK